MSHEDFGGGDDDCEEFSVPAGFFEEEHDMDQEALGDLKDFMGSATSHRLALEDDSYDDDDERKEEVHAPVSTTLSAKKRKLGSEASKIQETIQNVCDESWTDNQPRPKKVGHTVVVS